MKKLLNHSPETGVSEYWHWDPETEISTITNEQDVSYLLEVNRDVRNERNKHHFEGKDELGTHIAQIPLIVLARLTKEGRAPNQDLPAFKRWLNDPDNFWAKTHPGTI